MSDVRLSGFSMQVIEADATAAEWRPEETVARATAHYLADRELRPPGWACLALPEDAARSEDGEPSIEVALSDSDRDELVAEAEAQGVSLEALVAHAVMYLSANEHPHEAAPADRSARRRTAGRARSDDRNRA